MPMMWQLQVRVHPWVVYALVLLFSGCHENPPGELLRQAAYAGNVPEVDRILAQDVNAANDPDPSSGMTPLEFAVIAGHQEIAEKLVAHGADPNALDKLHMNAVAHAVRKDNWPMLKLLVEHGRASMTSDS